MKTSLYRMYDKHDQLLYVGISTDPAKRRGQHKSRKSWYQDIRHIEIEWFQTREQAVEAESLAIRREKPIYNKTMPEKSRVLKSTPAALLGSPAIDMNIVIVPDHEPRSDSNDAVFVPEKDQSVVMKHCRPGDMIYVKEGVSLVDGFWPQVFERGAFRG